MAIVTRSEFAEICKCTTNYLNTYIGRNKVAVCGEKGKFIDTENPLNKIFKKNTLANKKAAAKGEKPASKVVKLKPIQQEIQQVYEQVVQPVEKIYTKPETKAEKEAREKQNEQASEIVNWDMRKKIADALRAEQQAEKERISVEKLQGKLMPVDLVHQIFSINIRNIIVSFEANAQNLAGIYTDILAGGDRSKLSEIIDKLREKLMYLTSQAEQTAAIEIENVIEEYAEARSRGERK